MIGGVAWADVAIFVVLAFTTYRGFSRGFIDELAGIVALVAALIVPWFYNGLLDPQIKAVTTLALPIAHVIGMVLCSIAAYIIVLILASVLGGFSKLPLVGLGNKLGGAAIGFIKGGILIWIVLFVGLFFPLNPPIRSSLHHSVLAPYFVNPDAGIDHAIEGTLPVFVLPFLTPLFKRHHI